MSLKDEFNQFVAGSKNSDADSDDASAPEPVSPRAESGEGTSLSRQFANLAKQKQAEQERVDNRNPMGWARNIARAPVAGFGGNIGATVEGFGLDIERVRRELGFDPREIEETGAFKLGRSISEGASDLADIDPDYEGTLPVDAAAGAGSLAASAVFGLAGRSTGEAVSHAARGRGQTATEQQLTQYGAAGGAGQYAGMSSVHQDVQQFMQDYPELAREAGLDDDTALEIATSGQARLSGLVETASVVSLMRPLTGTLRQQTVRRMFETGINEYVVSNLGVAVRNDLRQKYDENHPIWDEIPYSGEAAGIGAAALALITSPLHRRGRRSPDSARSPGVEAEPGAEADRTMADSLEDAGFDASALFGEEAESPEQAIDALARNFGQTDNRNTDAPVAQTGDPLETSAPNVGGVTPRGTEAPGVGLAGLLSSRNPAAEETVTPEAHTETPATPTPPPVADSGVVDTGSMVPDSSGPVEPSALQAPAEAPQQGTGGASSLQNRDRSRASYQIQMDDIATNPDYNRVSLSRDSNTGAPMTFDADGDGSRVTPNDRGRSDTVTMSDGRGGTRSIPVQYAVVDADEVSASHTAQGMTNPNYGQSGLTALNNGRMAGLQEAHSRGNGSTYVEAMIADAESHGVSPEAIRSKSRPVLVRMFDRESLEGIDNPGAASNVPLSAELGSAEQATTDARSLQSSTLSLYQNTAVDSAANRDFVRAAASDLGGASAGGIFQGDGTLSADGRRRIEAALVARAFPDPGIIAELTESTDSSLKSLGGALIDIAGEWAQLVEAVQEGGVDSGMDITANIIEAVNLVRRSRQTGTSMSDLVGQGDIFSGGIPAVTEAVVRIFYRGDNLTQIRARDKIAAALIGYTREARRHVAGMDDMLGSAPTNIEILRGQRDQLEAHETPATPQPGAGLFGAGGQPTRQATGEDGASGQRPERPASRAETPTDGPEPQQPVATETPAPEAGVSRSGADESQAATTGRDKAVERIGADVGDHVIPSVDVGLVAKAGRVYRIQSVAKSGAMTVRDAETGETTIWRVGDQREALKKGATFEHTEAPAMDGAHRSRVIEGFEEINAFVDENNRAPAEDGDFRERTLATRLKSILADDAKRAELADVDRHGLLADESESAPESTPQPEASGTARSAQATSTESANDGLFRKKDGTPYPTEKSANLAKGRADLKGKSLEAVEVEGGWALRDRRAESAESVSETAKSEQQTAEALTDEQQTKPKEKESSPKSSGEHKSSRARVDTSVEENEAAQVEKDAADLPIEVSLDDLSWDLGYDANSMISRAPERRALKEQIGYVSEMLDLYRKMSPLADTKEKEATLKQELDRYKQDYLKRLEAVLRARSKVSSPAIEGTSGGRFPFKKNEGRIKSEENKTQELADWRERARNSIRRKLTQISSTDTEAVNGLRAELEKHESFQEIMKAANRVVRKKGLTDEQRVEKLKEVGLTENQVREILTPDFMGRVGYGEEILQSNSSKIKRLRKQIEEIENRQKSAEQTGGGLGVKFDGGEVEIDYTDGYVRVFYDEKPGKNVTDKLKGNRFNWSPSDQAWRRKLNEKSLQAAERVTGTNLPRDGKDADGAESNLQATAEDPAETDSSQYALPSDYYAMVTREKYTLQRDLGKFVDELTRPQGNPSLGKLITADRFIKARDAIDRKKVTADKAKAKRKLKTLRESPEEFALVEVRSMPNVEHIGNEGALQGYAVVPYPLKDTADSQAEAVERWDRLFNSTVKAGDDFVRFTALERPEFIDSETREIKGRLDQAKARFNPDGDNVFALTDAQVEAAITRANTAGADLSAMMTVDSAESRARAEAAPDDMRFPHSNTDELIRIAGNLQKTSRDLLDQAVYELHTYHGDGLTVPAAEAYAPEAYQAALERIQAEAAAPQQEAETESAEPLVDVAPQPAETLDMSKDIKAAIKDLKPKHSKVEMAGEKMNIDQIGAYLAEADPDTDAMIVEGLEQTLEAYAAGYSLNSKRDEDLYEFVRDMPEERRSLAVQGVARKHYAPSDMLFPHSNTNELIRIGRELKRDGAGDAHTNQIIHELKTYHGDGIATAAADAAETVISEWHAANPDIAFYPEQLLNARNLAVSSDSINRAKEQAKSDGLAPGKPSRAYVGSSAKQILDYTDRNIFDMTVLGDAIFKGGAEGAAARMAAPNDMLFPAHSTDELLNLIQLMQKGGELGNGYERLDRAIDQAFHELDRYHGGGVDGPVIASIAPDAYKAAMARVKNASGPFEMLSLNEVLSGNHDALADDGLSPLIQRLNDAIDTRARNAKAWSGKEGKKYAIALSRQQDLIDHLKSITEFELNARGITMREMMHREMSHRGVEQFRDSDLSGISSGGMARNDIILINRFIDSEGREPSVDATNLRESYLARRLELFRRDEEYRDRLMEFDSRGILSDAAAQGAAEDTGAELIESTDASEGGRVDDGAAESTAVHEDRPDTPELPADFKSQAPYTHDAIMEAGYIGPMHMNDAAEVRELVAPPDMLFPHENTESLRKLAEEAEANDNFILLDQALYELNKYHATPNGLPAAEVASARAFQQEMDARRDDGFADEGDFYDDDMMFSRGGSQSGMARDDVIQAASRLMRSWEGRPKINVVQSESGLPVDLKRHAAKKGATGSVNAAYWKGEVYLVADRMANSRDVRDKVLHEVVGHHGLRKLVGGDLSSVLNKVWAMHGRNHKDVKQIVDRYFTSQEFDVNNRDHRDLVAEEIIAHKAESGENPTLVQRAISAVRDWARGVGMDLEMNEADLANLIRKARRVAEKGGISTESPNQGNDARYSLTDPKKFEGKSAEESGPMLERQAKAQRGWFNGQPIDRVFKYVFDATGQVDAAGRWKPGVKLEEGVKHALQTWKPHQDGAFGWMTPALESVRAGLLDRHGLDPEFVRREFQSQSEQAALEGLGEKFVRTLAKESVGPKEARVLQQILNGEDVGEGSLRNLAKPIRQALDEMGQELVSLGLLNAETYQKNLGKYLHRSYMKYEQRQEGLPKWADTVMKKHRRKVHGDELKARGLKEDVTMERLLRDAPNDWWGHKTTKGKSDAQLVNTQWKMLDLVKSQGEGTGSLEGVDVGEHKARVVRRVFWPADVPVPQSMAEYTDRGTWTITETVKGGKLRLRRDFSKAERESMGEVLDARYNIIKTFQLMSHDIANGKFFRDIAQNPEWAVAEPGDGETTASPIEASRFRTFAEVDWVKVPDTKVKGTKANQWGSLAGMYVRPAIWRDLNEMDRMQHAGTWRTILNQWKINKTARSPVVHMNNVMSNFVLMDLIDVRMQDLVRGIAEYRNKGEMYHEARDNGAFGAGFVRQELNRNVVDPLLDELMVEARNERDTVEGRTRLLSKMGYKLWTLAKKGDRKMVDFYQTEDELFRMATFMRHRDLGASPAEAAMLAREQFLNYDIRAPWVNAARSTVLPFISYTYRAVPAIAQAIAHRPWKLAKYATIGYLANMLAFELEPGDEDEERRTMRSHQQGMTWAAIPFTDIGFHRMMRMPWKDEHDNPYYLDIFRWVPAGDVFDTNQGQIGVPSWLQFGGPLQLAFEMVLNRSAFTGRDIVDHEVDDWGDAAGKRLDYLWKAWMPSAAYIPGSWHYDKLESAVRGERDMLDRPYSVPAAAASGVGLKIQPHDVELGYYFRGSEIERRMRALRSEARSIERDAARGIGTERSRESDMRSIRRKIERLEDQANELRGR